jgi:adenine deaminase
LRTEPGSDRRRLVAVARGDEPPDLVIEGARVFCAFTREWLEGDLAIADGRFAGIGRHRGGEHLHAPGAHVVPGFVDAHVHVESSKLMIDEFARVLLRHGTTTIVCDPHEIANVLGTDGMHWLLDVCDGLPLDVYAMASSCVPASEFESPRRPLSLGDLEGILRRRRALGMGEMMNFPAVIAGEPGELAKLALHGVTHADGHAPGVGGRSLDAYLAAGIATDHESTALAEALEKRRRGAWVLIREASNARNLRDLLPLVREHGPEWCAFCTDDREPDDLLREGHINQMCRVAVEEGIAPEVALVLATLNPARCHGLREVGAIAPGWVADCLVLPDLREFRPSHVVKSGRVVVADGDGPDVPRIGVPLWVRQSVRVAPLTPDHLQVPAVGSHIRVIGVIPDQILTESLSLEPAVRNGTLVADPERDLVKIAVVERHHATGRVGVGFVRGFGLRRGAVGTTVAHDAHNIVVMGVDDADMTACVRRLAAIGGGIVAVQDGRPVGELPLPVAGLLSDQPADMVVGRLEALQATLADAGVRLASPFMTMSFLALSVIPSLKITDRGLVDVDRFELVPLQTA